MADFNDSRGSFSGSECSLNMDFSSSDFDADVDADLQEMEESGNNVDGIAPYQFEPEIDDDEQAQGQEGMFDDEERLASNQWCSCGSCDVMPTVTECLCCSEVPEICQIRDIVPGIKCIIEHPGFKTVCLDAFVLQTAYNAFRQYHNGNIPDCPARYRYTAYRQLVRWSWGYLGKKVRVPLPACAVAAIRRTFKDEDHDYKGFNYGDKL